MSNKARDLIPRGYVLSDSNKKKWIIESFIGIDDSALSYEATCEGKKSTDNPVFLKLKIHADASFTSEIDFYKQHATDAEVTKWIKHRNIQSNDLGIPRYLGHGKKVKIRNTNFDFLVLEKYDSDLQTLLNTHKKLLPKSAVLKIAYHTLRVLEYFHSKGFVHGDIQASNIRFDSPEMNRVYLLPQVHSIDKFNPKAMFWSEDRHNGAGTKRGDFESLLYSLIDWSGGILPWKNALPGVAKDMKIQAFRNVKQFLRDVFPSCECDDSSSCLAARKCAKSGKLVVSSECLQTITEFLEHVLFLKKIDDSNPNYGIIKIDNSIVSQSLFATDDCPSVSPAEKPTQQERSLNLSKFRYHRNSSNHSLSEMRQTSQNALSSPLPESNGFQPLVSPACSSGYSSRPSSQIDFHSDDSLPFKAGRFLDKVHHQSSKKVAAETKVAASRHVSGRRSVVPTNWEEWPDTCEWLTTWLDMIEPNLEVLRTAVPSEPELMAKQMQKVRVLLSAFHMQDSVDRMNHLVEALDELHPDSADVEKLKQIEQRWRDGLALLEERGKQLGDTSIKQLRNLLQQARNSLDKLLQSEEQLLHEFETLAEQLQSQQTLLVNSEIVVKQLTEVLDDSNFEAELQILNKLYEDLQQRIRVKKAEIEKSINDSCKKIDVWLAKERDTLEKKLVVSADHAALKKQHEFYQTVFQRIRQREAEVMKLVEKSGILSKSPNLKNGTLQQRVLNLHSRWDRLMKLGIEIAVKLQACVEHSNRYYEARGLFLEWLDEAEQKPTLSNDTQKQLEELNVLGNVIRAKSGEFERMMYLAQSFICSCNNNGGDMVKNELDTIKDRWHKFNKDLRDRTQSLEDLNRRSVDFKESLHKIDLCVDELVSHDVSGGADKESEILNGFKELGKKWVCLKKSLDVVRQQANEIKVQNSGKRKKDIDSDRNLSRACDSVDNDSGSKPSRSTKRRR